MDLRGVRIMAIVGLIATMVPESTAFQSMKKPDTDQYDQGGPYLIPLNLDLQSRQRVEAEVRGFVWEHWHRPRRGAVKVTRYSKEGERSITVYEIEPNENGTWHVTMKIQRTLVERTGPKHRVNDSVAYEASIVEQVLVPEAQRPSKDVWPPESYRLLLKDKAGKVLSTL